MNTTRLFALLSASILSIGVTTSSGLAQVHHRCPCPCPPTPEPDSQLDEGMEDRQPEELPEVADLAAEAAIASGPQAALPYMLGDLLKANRSIAYNIHRAGAQADFESGGAIGFRNAKVAENNNALPKDRFYVRHNYFSNAIRVRGLSQDTRIIPDPDPMNPMGTLEIHDPVDRNFDAHIYTLGVEKTFFHNMVSLEARVPFADTLASHLDIEAGRTRGVSGPDLAIEPTPGNTLGVSTTELQDITFVLKALLLQTCTSNLSGGLAVTAPTGRDVSVRVVDFWGPADAPATDQRTRIFNIENDTWSISPFLAYYGAPDCHTFVNGFIQYDIPVGESQINFFDFNDAPMFVGQPPLDLAATDEIADQALLHVDVGIGRWIYRDHCAAWVTALAAVLELHYTMTLEDAEIVELPRGELILRTDPMQPREPAPRVGNLQNRIDILNATAGAIIGMGPKAVLNLGVAAPLRDDADRTFDIEGLAQFNYFY